MEIEPIAHFRSPFPDKFGIPRQAGLSPSVRGQIVFEPGFRSADAVRGLEGFDYIWLIWGFSANSERYSRPAVGEITAPADKTRFQPTVRPPRLGGNERVGVFASRSPFRPNPLGLSSVSLVSVSDGDFGPALVVSGADLMDGTPIYDIKPYLPQFDSHPDAKAGYVDEHEFAVLEVEFPSSLLSLVPSEKRKALIQALSQDPRPHYQDEPERVYGMRFGNLDVRFVVSGSVLSVVDVSSVCLE